VIKYGSHTYINRDSVRAGDSLRVDYNIVNVSTDNSRLTGTITTIVTTNKTDFGDSTPASNPQFVDVGPGDSVYISASVFVNDTTFKKGEECIVVIWPTGGGTESLIGKRQIPKKLFVNYGLSINPVSNNLSRVSFYPNPFRGEATIKLTSNRFLIDNVSIVNMQGQAMPVPVLRNGQMDLSYLQGGLYMLKVRFSDGAVSVFRVLKQ
jgi:hypothetical protein